MTVIVEGKNYTQLSSCDTTSAGGTWDAGALDEDQFKEGAASLSATLKNAGVQSVIFTPTSPVNLVDKHLRVWLIGTQGGKMALTSGIQISIAGGNGVRGYWYMGGREKYSGGWINLVVDTNNPVDNGTKPASLTGIVTIGIHIANESSTKNAVNTWWDNLTVSDGLRCFDKNGEGGFGLDDIYNYENQTASGGFGIVRKIGGVYFANGEIEIGDRLGISGCEFTDTNKILVYENRKVSTGLYTLTITGNSTTGTVVTFGQKSAGKGVAGCTIVAETGSVPYKIIAQSGNIDNCQFLGCSFVNASGTQLSGYLSGAIEALNCSWVASAEVMPKDTYLEYCNFINSPGRGVRMWVTGHNLTGCNFIGCATGIEISGASGTYESTIDAHIFAGCDTDLESSINNGIVTGNLVNNCNASSFFHSDGGTGVLINAKTLYVKVQDKDTNPISGARVRLSVLSDGTEIFKDYTSADGEISKPYNYGGTPVNIGISIRKSSSLPKYFPVNTYGTIGDAGFSLTYAMTQDTIAIGSPAATVWTDGSEAENIDVGKTNWNNPTNALTQNDINSNSLVGESNYNDRLTVSGFGFSLPAGAVIDGIMIEIDKYSSATTDMSDYRVQLVSGSSHTLKVDNQWDSGVIWDKSDTDSYKEYGSSGSKMGWNDITVNDINDGHFGVCIQAYNHTVIDSAYVDHIAVKILYSS